MKSSKDNGCITIFIFSAVLFVLCISAGIFTSYRFKGEIFESLSEFVKSTFSEKIEFKSVFSRAVINDFRYSVLILVCALGVYASFIPLSVFLYKGFASGLAVGIASRAVEKGELVRFSSAVFLSCLFTVPIYVIMYAMCRIRAKNSKNIPCPAKQKVKDYISYASLVLIMFSLLCIADLIQAFFSPLFIGIN